MRIPRRKPRGRRDLRIPYFDIPSFSLSSGDRDDFMEARQGHHAIGPLMSDVGEESLIYTRTTYHKDDWERDRASIEGYVHDEFWHEVGRKRVCITQAPRMVVDVSTFNPERLVEVTVEGWGRRAL